MARTKAARNKSQHESDGNNAGSGASTSRSDSHPDSGGRRAESNTASSSHTTDDNKPRGEIYSAPPYDPQDPENTGAMGEYNNFLLSYGLKPYEVEEASAIMDALEKGR